MFPHDMGTGRVSECCTEKVFEVKNEEVAVAADNSTVNRSIICILY
jgi:hypothetical protein